MINKTQPDMIPMIQSVLSELNIEIYNINEVQKESVELYFIKKSLDMRRQNQVTDLTVTVFRDFERDGKKMRGSSSTVLYVTMDREEVKSALKDAYYAASFVYNPFYEIPSGEPMDQVTMESRMLAQSVCKNAMDMAEALYAADTYEDVFINSAEFFSTKKTVRIVSSEGIDVSYVKASLNGEFVAQCPSPTDVETYRSFRYDDLETEDLKTLALDTLELTKSRAAAANPPKTGKYTVILSDEQVKTMLSYYTERANSGYIYPGYSNYKIGEKVQGNNVTGELLNITLKASVPYSEEGIPMMNRPLITDGVLDVIEGSCRFAYYLGIPATGNYSSVIVDNGTISMEDMKKSPYLHVVNFSDFQMDSLTGDFGGEIRLAFLSDGTTVTPVTGGSISGNINNYHDQLIFSTERQVRASFEGPRAMMLKDIQVSGC